MRPCDIPGCQGAAVGDGFRLCEKHSVRQSSLWLGRRDYAFIGMWNYGELGRTAGIGTLENALLLLLFGRNETGPFEGGQWREPESGLAYDFLRQHLRSAFGR